MCFLISVFRHSKLNASIAFSRKDSYIGRCSVVSSDIQKAAKLVKTKEAIDADGWLHSGDVGAMSTDGNHMLRITGRLKELIISAGGENIAPVPIEDKVKQTCPAVSNAMMIGDKRKYNVMLLTVKTELNTETGISTGALVGDARCNRVAFEMPLHLVI